MNNKNNTSLNISCFHCGDLCSNKSFQLNEKYFCCEGCKTVYEILNQNELCAYYEITNQPGNSAKEKNISKRYDFLEDPHICDSLYQFKSESLCIVQLYIPKIHCASCIWLLENMKKMHNGIIYSQVQFQKKEITIQFNPKKVTLKTIAEYLDKIGYDPEFNLGQVHKTAGRSVNKKLIYKIGIAGFCFGNIMMLSFPEYLSAKGSLDEILGKMFNVMNIILAAPVLFYSASDYFINTWKAIRQRIFSIDIPTALGLAAIALRSLYDILSKTGPGYFDSLTGLVFFLLIGRYLQDATYYSLSFDRNFESYFPFSLKVESNGKELYKPVAEIITGDKVILHQNEILPCDAYLLSEETYIDYSFVSGESDPVEKKCGEIIYAGAKLKGSVVEMEVIKPVTQSYLTQLWNSRSKETVFSHSYSQLANVISKYFTFVIIGTAISTYSYWFFQNESGKAIQAFSSILVIACPCALAITVPFVWGNVMRWLGKKGMYTRHSNVLEMLASCDTIVFDKTGTLTTSQPFVAAFVSDNNCTERDKVLISTTVKNSIHPYSRSIYNYMNESESLELDSFNELPGKGIEATYKENTIIVGSSSYIFNSDSSHYEGHVHVMINNIYKGYFIIEQKLRDGLPEMLLKLQRNYKLYLLSGDTDRHLQNFKEYFSPSDIYFNQTPKLKYDFIKSLQAQGKKVIMIGDGLNDAASLQQANAGIAVTEDVLLFTPASDVILRSNQLYILDRFLTYIKTGKKIIAFTFAYSLLYNLIGLFFAVQGALSPFIAAVLMPLSSLSVIGITYLSTWLKIKSIELNNRIQ
jgi:Cu+-exporting ATPase